MTRREEIEWEAGGIVNRMIERGISQCYDTYYRAFQEGAKWADKTMLDKACEWLKEHYAPAGFVDGIFRKAMEE